VITGANDAGGVGAESARGGDPGEGLDEGVNVAGVDVVGLNVTGVDVADVAAAD
jgi:hypothetical protein